MPRTISHEVARRYLVLRHFLAPPRSLPAEPASVLRVFERLGSVQFDPLDIVGRNHDLVLLARINGYKRQWTDDLLYRERTLYETYNKGLSLVPTSELPWYRVSWDLYRERFEKATFQDHAALVNELVEAKQQLQLRRVLGRWARYDVIAIDEVGYVPLAELGAEFLFQVISERAERSAVLLTTNLPFSEWTQVIPNARLCKAVLDRITDRAHIIETGTDSFRFKRTLA